MTLQKYDVVRTIIPFSTTEDKKIGHKTLNSYRLMEAQLSGEYKERPCVVLGTDKKSGNIILAEIRTNRNKNFRSMLNNPAEAGIEHESSILTHKNQLIYVEDDISSSLDSLKCGHLSEKDIARFEYEFMETNFNRNIAPKETTTDRQMRIRAEMNKNLEPSQPSDKELINKLNAAEARLSSSADYNNEYEI
ncbi:MAG: hypothetical protein D8H99_73810 [Streptococcus sp.]|nr:MAG: hypothetical protein D8H99_73810 [Streptococcus sp.]